MCLVLKIGNDSLTEWLTRQMWMKQGTKVGMELGRASRTFGWRGGFEPGTLVIP